MQARGLRNRRSYTIGLILSSATHNPFFTKVSHSVRMAANAAGLSVLNFNHNYDSRTESEGIRRLVEHNVEAVIACHIFNPQNLDPVHQLGIPIIEIEREILPIAHHLLFDPLPGVTDAVIALKNAGHQRISFLGGRTVADATVPQRPDSVEHQRGEAFRSAMRASGFDPRHAPLDFIDYQNFEHPDDLQGARWAIRALSREDRPTAILVGSDVLAAGVLQAAYRLGLRVPDDLSIVGYDDSLAQFLAPPMASISQPYDDLGRTAIEMVLAAKDAPGPGLLVSTLPAHFMSRPSYGPPVT